MSYTAMDMAYIDKDMSYTDMNMSYTDMNMSHTEMNATSNITTHTVKLTDLGAYQAGHYIYLILSPVILIFGLFGNMVSFIIIYPKARGSNAYASNLYLSVLAIVDTAALFIPGVRGCLIHYIHYDPMLASKCGWFMFFYFTITDFSVYVIVCMTADRCLNIFYPYNARQISTIQRSVITIALVAVGLILINFHLVFTAQPVYKIMANGNLEASYCGTVPKHEHWYNFIWPWIDLTVYSFLPFSSLTFFNACILFETAKQMRQIHAEGVVPDMRMAKQRRTNTRLALICMLFIVTTSPVVILHIVEPYWQREDVDEVAKHMLITAIAEHMMYLNNSLNLLLYCASWKKFRQDFRQFTRRPQGSFRTLFAGQTTTVVQTTTA